MYRVALLIGIAVGVSACSMNSSTISSGFADNSAATGTYSSRPSSSAALGGDPSLSRGAPAWQNTGQKTAALNDKAQKGTFEKAPAGALADRDYSGTRLDPDRARDIINAYRKEQGLKPLKLNTELTEAAKAHSRDLAKWDRISHYGSDGSNPWDRVKRTGYKARLAAENVGTGQLTFEEVMRGWKDSPGHNKNLLLADASEMGLALVQDPKTEFKSFWTLVIGTSL